MFPSCIARYSNSRLLDKQTRTKHHAHLTLFCLTDSECDDIPTELDFENIFGNVFTQPSNFNVSDNFTTPFPLPQWPGSFTGADFTHGMMKFYVGFNAGWAVTCLIAIGKWLERAVEVSCSSRIKHFREALQRSFLP